MAGLRERLYGCVEGRELTCGACALLEWHDSYASCGWIRGRQQARGVAHIDDHVVPDHPACSGFAPRLGIVPEQESERLWAEA